MEEASQQSRVMRRRRSRAEVPGLIKRFEQSGQSLSAFCQQHALARASMASMLRRHRGSRAHGQEPSSSQGSSSFPAKFVSVEIVDGGHPASCRSSLVVELPRGLRVFLDRDFDAVALERLLAVEAKA
jgi:hypothetical protein